MPSIASRRALLGAIVPHAPLLTPQVSAAHVNTAVARLRDATRALARSCDRLVVLVSPHARTSGIYLSEDGDLGRFGVSRAYARYGVEKALAQRLSHVWGRPLLEEPLDHGIVVPLLLGFEGMTGLAVGLAEHGGTGRDVDELAAAVTKLNEDLTVVASVNAGAGVTPRAPLTELPAGQDLESELAGALRTDAELLRELAPRLARDGGSCGAAPLGLIGCLFPGRSFDVLCHEWPYGVGYMVARSAST